MDASIQVVQAQLDEVEQAAERVTSSIKTYVGALNQFLDLIIACGGQQIPVATLESFGHTLTLIADDLAKAGNKTLSRIASARDAGQPKPHRAHDTPETPSKGTDSSTP